MVNTNITNACAAGQWQALTRQEKKELANYHRASFGSPTNQHPFKQCMRTLSTFPGLTTDLISKHLSPIIAIALGHQDQEAKPLRSTNPSTPEVTINQPDTDLAPDAESRTSVICSMVFSTESLHSFLTKLKIPVKSSRENLYIFVLFNYDNNSVFPRSHNPGCMSMTYNTLLSKSYQIQHHILYNECSQELKAEFSKH